MPGQGLLHWAREELTWFPASIACSDWGERENPAAVRLEASRAFCSRAYSVADSSLYRCGSTIAPLEAAISTQVENDRTSTTMATCEWLATSRTPCSPHSKRTSNEDCDANMLQVVVSPRVTTYRTHRVQYRALCLGSQAIFLDYHFWLAFRDIQYGLSRRTSALYLRK